MEKTEVTLKAARINSGLDQKEFAKFIGVSNLTVSNWELGKSEPNLTQLKKISEASGIPIDNLVMSRPKVQLS